MCRWIVTGGPTALAAPPDASGGAQGGGGSAARRPPPRPPRRRALIEFPRPAAALGARRRRALARCEIELYALADVFERDPSDSRSKERSSDKSTSTSAAAVRARRVGATRLARSACAMPEVRAVHERFASSRTRTLPPPR